MKSLFFLFCILAVFMLNDAAKVHQEEPKAGIRKESISICVVLLPKSWWPQSGAKTTTKNKSLGRRSNSGRAGSTKSRGFFGSSKPGGNTGGNELKRMQNELKARRKEEARQQAETKRRRKEEMKKVGQKIGNKVWTPTYVRPHRKDEGDYKQSYQWK